MKRTQGGTLLLAIDDEHQRRSLDAQLRALGYKVVLADDTLDVAQSIHINGAHVVVVGVRAAHVDLGIAVGERIRVITSTPFVFVGDWLSAEDRLRAFRAGAEDVIRLPCPDEELHARLDVVLRRLAAVPDVLEFENIVVNGAAHTVLRDGKFVAVTSIEFALLKTFMRHRGQVLSKTQLLADVWGYEHYDVNLVEVHVSALRRKLEAFGPRVLHTVRGVGYVLRPHTVAMMATA
jgi:DNA-binding response OmpR family regulator